MNTWLDDTLDQSLGRALERTLGFDRASVGPAQWRRALGQRARQLGLDVASYAGCASGSAAEQEQLLHALNIDESWIERDPPQWAAIRASLAALPVGQPLLALCAPCARGEEAWTLAALMYELGHRAPNCRIVGIDVAADAIRMARSAWLPRHAWRERDRETPWWLRAGTAPVGDAPGWVIAPVLQAMVRFEQANLLDWQPDEPHGFDLLLSRNFLIYLSAAAQQVWGQRLHAAAAPGATLWTARSERLDTGCGTSRFLPIGADSGWCIAPGVAALSVSPVAVAEASRRRPRALAAVPPDAAPRKCSAVPSTASDPPALQVVAPGHGAELAQALLALERDDLSSAEALLRQVLYLEHGCEEALLHLAALRTRQGDPEEARRLHDRLRRLRGAPA
jgi:chemotaxis protein methyltransferase WspC